MTTNTTSKRVTLQPFKCRLRGAFTPNLDAEIDGWSAPADSFGKQLNNQHCFTI